MDADFCVEALREALATYGKPEIFNTDQGSQCTSGAWIDVPVDAGIKISMPLVTLLRNALPVIDGKGRFLPSRDIAWQCPSRQRIDIFVERLWRSLKYECAYLNACETGSEMRRDREVAEPL